MLRRTGEEEWKRSFHVGRQLDRPVRLGPNRRPPPIADEHHDNELIAPGVSRKDLRWGELMAPAAGDARLLLVTLRICCGPCLLGGFDRWRRVLTNGELNRSAQHGDETRSRAARDTGHWT